MNIYEGLTLLCLATMVSFVPDLFHHRTIRKMAEAIDASPARSFTPGSRYGGISSSPRDLEYEKTIKEEYQRLFPANPLLKRFRYYELTQFWGPIFMLGCLLWMAVL